MGTHRVCLETKLRETDAELAAVTISGSGSTVTDNKPHQAGLPIGGTIGYQGRTELKFRRNVSYAHGWFITLHVYFSLNSIRICLKMKQNALYLML